MARQNRELVLAVALLAVLAGCAGGLTGGDAADTGAMDGDGAGGGGDDARSGPGEGDGDRDDGSGDASAASAAYEVQQRAIVRTGEVRLRVSDFEPARDRVVGIAEERDGFVAASEESVQRADGQRWTEGSVTVRVPSGEFSSAFRAVREIGAVVRSSSETKDVSDQLVDLEARIRNLENRRDRLRSLYEEANSTDETLRVGQELSKVQEEIERLTAKRRALQDRVAYATITVGITEPRPTPTPTPTPTPEQAYHETSPGTAFLESVNGVVVAIRTIVVTTSYLLPYLLSFGLPVGVAALVYRRRDRLLDR